MHTNRYEQSLMTSLAACQVWRRTSIVTTLWNFCYDHMLCDALYPGDAFIDFIAVSPSARYVALHWQMLQYHSTHHSFLLVYANKVVNKMYQLADDKNCSL